mmetsp:Transcript_103756/g.300077  ORF Transcript_103756/g.300077 Transcript_103756/m.300077 type:complete len:225 (+) Transcript_103756:1317-1991(+)
MLSVFAFGVPVLRFRRTVMTSSLPNLADGKVRCLPAVKAPSESKKTCSSLSPRSSDEPEVEKPSRTSCRGFGVPRGHARSDVCKASITFNSNAYRPAFMPTLARAPAMRYCIPPSVSVASTVSPRVGTAFKVVSSTRKPTASLSAARLSGLSSSSVSASSSTLASFAGGSSPSAASPSAFRFNPASAGCAACFAAAFPTTGMAAPQRSHVWSKGRRTLYAKMAS